MENAKQKMNCDHCGKKECENCVAEDGKNFCCENCCDDYKAKKESQSKEPANVCKFC